MCDTNFAAITCGEYDWKAIGRHNDCRVISQAGDQRVDFVVGILRTINGNVDTVRLIEPNGLGRQVAIRDKTAPVFNDADRVVSDMLAQIEAFVMIVADTAEPSGRPGDYAWWRDPLSPDPAIAQCFLPSTASRF
jgi:hypothetical protein